MRETPEDLLRLQALLDDSDAQAGAPSWAIEPERILAADMTIHQ